MFFQQSEKHKYKSSSKGEIKTSFSGLYLISHSLVGGGGGGGLTSRGKKLLFSQLSYFFPFANIKKNIAKQCEGFPTSYYVAIMT